MSNLFRTKSIETLMADAAATGEANEVPTSRAKNREESRGQRVVDGRFCQHPCSTAALISPNYSSGLECRAHSGVSKNCSPPSREAGSLSCGAESRLGPAFAASPLRRGSLRVTRARWLAEPYCGRAAAPKRRRREGGPLRSAVRGDG